MAKPKLRPYRIDYYNHADLMPLDNKVEVLSTIIRAANIKQANGLLLVQKGSGITIVKTMRYYKKLRKGKPKFIQVKPKNVKVSDLRTGDIILKDGMKGTVQTFSGSTITMPSGSYITVSTVPFEPITIPSPYVEVSGDNFPVEPPPIGVVDNYQGDENTFGGDPTLSVPPPTSKDTIAGMVTCIAVIIALFLIILVPQFYAAIIVILVFIACIALIVSLKK
jgi:hypothetical protein